MSVTEDLGVNVADHVATVEIQRPPHNFFDYALIQQIADAFEALDEDAACRAIVLCAEGKSFCAGANFGDGSSISADGDAPGAPNRSGASHLYMEAVRLFRTRKPIIGAIHGAAIGGGLGLAMVPDFRVTCPEARFSANFTRLGFHPGFGLTVTLPHVVGETKAALMFYTSRRFKGDEALEMGLADVLVPQDQVRAAALELATEIAQSSPLGVMETRATLRQGLAERIKAATDHELEVQTSLRKTQDFKEGVKAMSERRLPNFTGQ
ncbi:MAG: enoyl-CoA hydratase/isomerase family protein [Methyloligellaceae bacterium]